MRAESKMFALWGRKSIWFRKLPCAFSRPLGHCARITTNCSLRCTPYSVRTAYIHWSCALHYDRGIVVPCLRQKPFISSYAVPTPGLTPNHYWYTRQHRQGHENTKRKGSTEKKVAKLINEEQIATTHSPETSGLRTLLKIMVCFLTNCMFEIYCVYI